MKKFFKFIPAAFAVVALSSCSSDDLFGLGGSAKADGNTIHASINNGVTRVGMAVDADGNRGLVFSDDDQMNVYTIAANNFNNYTVTSGALTDKATFTKASGTLDITDGEDYYGVVKSPAARIYGLSANANNEPELTMQIPARYTHAKADATWGDDKSGSSYKMPLPLWGKVTEENGEMSVGFNYLTGFMKIEIINLRAGSKSVRLTSNPAQPISGFFNAVLDPANPANSVLGTDEALTTGNTITVDLPEVNTYEGVDTVLYIPVIAQTYRTTPTTPALKVDVLNAAGGVIETVYEAATDITVRAGHGISLTRGMTVFSGATTGADISSKLYELTSGERTEGNAGKPVIMRLLNAVTPGEQIIIDKNTKNNITLVFAQPIPAPLTIVEGTMKSVDQATGDVTWSTEVTDNNSESQAFNHEVNIVYDNQAANGNLDLWLPYSKINIAGKDVAEAGGAVVDYTGSIQIVASKDGGTTIDESARIADAGANANFLTIIKDGKTTVNGFVNQLQVQGDGDVEINNLNEAMNVINHGLLGAPVKGKLTINGATVVGGTARAAANHNSAVVNIVASYSTGAFKANNLDVDGGAYTFNEITEGIEIANNIINNIVTIVSTDKRNNLTLTNTVVGTYNYTAGKKATVTATGKAAIVTLTGDADDMLTISTTWDGTSAPAAATTTAHAVTAILGTEVHTAYQFASVTAATTTVNIKGTTTIDLDNKTWAPKSFTGAITIDGDFNNNQESRATIKNLKNIPTTNQLPGSMNGLIATAAGLVTINDINFEGVQLQKYDYTGSLVARAQAGADIQRVDVTGVAIKSLESRGIGGLIGSLEGTVANTIKDVNVKGTEITNSNQKAGGLIGWNKSTGATQIDGVNVEVTTITANDIVGGMIGQNDGAVNMNTLADEKKSNVKVTTINNTNLEKTGGLIGWNNGNANIYAVTVDVTAIKGVFYMGGMIGYNNANATFGNGSKDYLCSVNANFQLNNRAAFQKTAANKLKWGSVNTYIGHSTAGKNISITKYCKHGAVQETVAQKEALNFKENVVVTNDGINTNYHYFWSGNAWIGTIGDAYVEATNTWTQTSVVNFPDDHNLIGARTVGVDFCVRKTVPQYIAESYSDWDE